MATVVVKVDNVDLAKKEIQDAIDKGLEMIGMQCETYASLLVPVDTGRLKGSLTHAMTTVVETHIMEVSANTEYAFYVEEGTSKMEARPYLRPAAEKHKKEYGAMMEYCLQNA